MLGTKDTQIVNYDGYFKDIFHETFEKEYKDKFEEKGIWYEHRPIDDLMS
jgi:isocitrate dehydrogenase